MFFFNSAIRRFYFCIALACASSFLATGCQWLAMQRDKNKKDTIEHSHAYLANMNAVDAKDLGPFKKDFEGQWTILALGFTNCPDICPNLMGLYRNILGELPAKQSIVSLGILSVDPERDSQEVLTNYVNHFSPLIRVYQYEPTELAALAKLLAAAYGKDPTRGEPIHSTNLWVISPAGTWVGYYRSEQLESGDVLRDLKQLTSMSGATSVSSTVPEGGLL